ncbi:hypothetical protein [Paraburkholderia caledonica]
MAIQQMTGQVGMQVVGDIGQRMQENAVDSAKQAVKDYNDALARGDTAGMAQAKADYAAASQQYALWADDGAARVAAHAVVAGVGAGMGGGSVPGALGGTLAGDIAGNAVSGATRDTLGGTLLSNLASGLAGAAAGGSLGGAAGAMSGANGALNANLYNRQLHPEEKSLAQKIAANAAARGIRNADGSPVTASQIENAMRAANNSQYGEIVATGVAVPLNTNTPVGAVYDTTGMKLVSGSSGNYLVQDPSMLTTPSQMLQDLILANTGGGNSPYSWNDPSSSASPTISATTSALTQAGVYMDGTGSYRQTVSVGGETFNVGLHGSCATADCVMYGANINWSDPGSQSMAEAINVQLAEAAANGAAVATLGSPTGFVAQSATYVGALADGAKAYITRDGSALAPDIVGLPLGIVLTGMHIPEAAANQVNTLYQQFLGGWFSNSATQK